MIIQVRGANGAGKTTVVRRVMDQLGQARPISAPKRTRPIGYVFDQWPRGVFVPGSYENPTGGCDTISSIETIFDLVSMYAEEGLHVLFEGIVAQHSATRLLGVWKKFRERNVDTEVIVLKTDLGSCIASVVARRQAKGNFEPFDPENVEKEWRGVQSARKRLIGDGMKIVDLDRDEAPTYILERLR
jgi:hypothetical protein